MVTIRYAEIDDAAAIADIYNQAIRTTTATFDTLPKSVEDRVDWLESHGTQHPVFVAELDGEVVGWAALSPWSDRCAYSETAETSFYVSEEFRGQGIGRQLKERILQAGEEIGFHTILARVAEGSDASLHINLSIGFEMIGTMKEVGFKFGKRLDVHMMQYIYESR